MNGILDHFKERHPRNLSANDDITINNISVTIDDRHMYLVAQNRFIFIVSFKIDTMQKLAFWAVQHIGSKKSANQHVYELQVTSNEDNRRKAIFTDHCFNDAMDVNEIFRSAKCAVMPLDMMAHFIKDKKLTFSISIKRYQPGIKKGPGSEGDNQTVQNQQNGPRAPNQQNGPRAPSAGPKHKGQGGNSSRGKSPGPLMHKGPGPHTQRGPNKQHKRFE